MKRLTRNPFHQTDVLKLRCGPETDIVEVHNTDLAAFDRRKLVDLSPLVDGTPAIK
jgi:hypothetical protein